jgi:hypothetical protein
MRQALSALLLGFAGFVASFVLERYVTGWPEWLWRLIGLICVAAGLTGAALTDTGVEYMRHTRSSVLYVLFAIVFGVFGIAVHRLVVKPLSVTVPSHHLGFLAFVSTAEWPDGKKIGDRPWSPKFTELALDIANSSVKCPGFIGERLV